METPFDHTSLYLVPTPIGNLEDITIRAIRVLKECNVILAEDTRQTSILLKHHQIQNKVQSNHSFNEHKNLQSFIDMMMKGDRLALVSDAGTPGISDPGYLLVRECLKNNLKVECLPGATAFVPALVKSGLPCDGFVFEGFLPQKKGRHTKLESLREEKRTMVFYESPFRLIKTLEQFGDFFGKDRLVSVSRELTKIYEETFIGTIESVITHFSEKTVKGEIVIVLEGKK